MVMRKTALSIQKSCSPKWMQRQQRGESRAAGTLSVFFG